MNACKVCIGYVIRCSSESGEHNRFDAMQNLEGHLFVCLLYLVSFLLNFLLVLNSLRV